MLHNIDGETKSLYSPAANHLEKSSIIINYCWENAHNIFYNGPQSSSSITCSYNNRYIRLS